VWNISSAIPHTAQIYYHTVHKLVNKIKENGCSWLSMIICFTIFNVGEQIHMIALKFWHNLRISASVVHTDSAIGCFSSVIVEDSLKVKREITAQAPAMQGVSGRNYV
jgi:hypothetical protein